MSVAAAVSWKTRSGVYPERMNAVRADVRHMAVSSSMEATPNSMPSTSMVKSIPPTGALKIAAIPAPAPQAIMTVSILAGMRNSRPTLLAIAAPEYAIGPSAPAEPPHPRVTPLVSMGATVRRRFIRRAPADMSLRMRSVAYSIGTLNTYLLIMPESIMPVRGTASRI